MALSAFALCLLLSAPAAEAETRIEVLGVRNRLAEDLVPALAAIAGRDGVVTAASGKLVVRAAPAALAEIKRVLAELDVPQRSLWITVKQSLDRSQSAEGVSVAGQGYVTPGTQVVVPPTIETRAGVTLERHGSSRTVVSGGFAGSSADESSSDVQRLQALEGSRAFIRVGHARPVAQAGIVTAGGQVAVVPGTAYQEADVGFWVVPRVAGDVVTIEVLATNDRLDARGGVELQEVQTTVRGRLGEWMSVGGVARSRAERSTGSASAERRQARDERTVQLKVEEVR
jgi:hypothetical protein